jgi:hypothetical protein
VVVDGSGVSGYEPPAGQTCMVFEARRSDVGHINLGSDLFVHTDGTGRPRAWLAEKIIRCDSASVAVRAVAA